MFLVPFNRSILDSKTSPSKARGLSSEPLSKQFQPVSLATPPSLKFSKNIALKRQKFVALIVGSSTLAARLFIESLAKLKQWLNISLRTLFVVLSPLNNYSPYRRPYELPEADEQKGELIDVTSSYSNPKGGQLGESSSNCDRLNLLLNDCSHFQSVSKSRALCLEASANLLAAECAAEQDNNCSDRNSGNSFSLSLSSNDESMERAFQRGVTQRASSHENKRHLNAMCNNNLTNIQQEQRYRQHTDSTCLWNPFSIAGGQTPDLSDESLKVVDTVAEGRGRQTPTTFQGQQREQGQPDQQQQRWRSCGLQTGSPENGIASQPQRHQQPQRGSTGSHKHSGFKYNTCEALSSSSSAARLMTVYQQQQQQQQQQDHLNAAAFRRNANLSHNNGSIVGETEVGEQSPMVLVSKETLSELTDKIAFSMDKMKDLEEQVRVIPELRRRLEDVISDSNSGSLKNCNLKRSRFSSTTNDDDTYSVDGHSRRRHLVPEDSGADILSSLHPALQRHYNSFRHSTRNNNMDHHRRGGANGRSGSNATTNSLDGRSPMLLGSQDSGSLLAFDNNNRGSRQSFTMSNSTNHESSNGSRRGGTGDGGGNKIGSPKVEYEDLINDLISLSYSVNYVSHTNSENSQSSDQQVKEPLATTQIDDHPRQHNTNQVDHRNFASIGNLSDRVPTAHHINYRSNNNNNHQHHHSSMLLGAASHNAATDNRSFTQNNIGSLNHHAPLTSLPGNIGWRRNSKQSQQLNFNDDKNTNCAKATPTTNAIKTRSSLESSSSLHSNSSNSGNNNNISNSNRYHSNILTPFHLTNYSNHTANQQSNNKNMILDPSLSNYTYHQQNSFQQNNNNHHHQQHAPNKATLSYLSRNYNGNGSLSLQTTPVKSQLDCGCQSFKEHLRYNSISREQRLNHAKSQSLSNTTITTTNTSSDANSLHRSASKTDASTNTELSMADIVTRIELNGLMADMQKTYSTLSSSNLSRQFRGIFHKSSSLASESSSGSVSGPKSSSADPSRSDSCEADENLADDDNAGSAGHKGDCSSGKDVEDKLQRRSSSDEDEPEEDDDDDENDNDGDEEEDANVGSFAADGPYSLGSSYQDPSDFEEYCAYGASLDRHTKDFMSQSTKIPNDLRFALIRLNDFIKRKRSIDKIESSSSCIEVIKKEWFEAAANKDSQALKTKLYVDYFESFTKQLLNTVVNLTDSAGNTAMHYAASHYKLDIIEVLLDTKVCDVNSRNRAGYTPIMLLALAGIETTHQQEVARRLFSMGDVNIKARSDGQTALMLAASHSRVTTCKLLLECGADPSLQDFDGSTALMCGSERGNEEVVKCLLAHKLTDPSAIDNDGLDALTIAMNNGHKNIGLLLYAAKNVPRLARPSINPSYSNASGYLCASLRRSRGKLVTNYVRRADSLLNYTTSKTG